MKQCYKCKSVYPINFFKFRNKSKNIKFSYCNKCMVEYRRQHYLLHKDYYLKKAHMRNSIVKNERAKFIRDYFAKHPCVDCGNTNPIVLEFDHKEASEKLFNVGKILYSGSMLKVLNEIDKCEVRCGNCHKIKTAHQNNWKKSFEQNNH